MFVRSFPFLFLFLFCEPGYAMSRSKIEEGCDVDDHDDIDYDDHNDVNDEM